VAILLAGYSASWTGFGDYTLPNGDFLRGKTLWDWMELLIIPGVLAGGAYYLNRSERKNEREIATDRQQEAALQSYIDRMAELLLEKKLRTTENEEVRDVARTRTLTVLRGLDPIRKGSVLKFLFEAGLINRERPIINLSGANLYLAILQFADLSGANLQNVHMPNADLSRTDLRGADLQGTNLQDAKLWGTNLEGANLQSASLPGAFLYGAILKDANLQHAYLQGANLQDANLQAANLQHAELQAAYLKDANIQGANLQSANLQNADVTDRQLAEASELKDATMPNGTKHD
jgi:hypothetical protein